MLLKDISFPAPQENIFFDESLFRENKECLRFWESPVVFIVLGRTGKAQEDIRNDKAHPQWKQPQYWAGWVLAGDGWN